MIPKELELQPPSIQDFMHVHAPFRPGKLGKFLSLSLENTYEIRHYIKDSGYVTSPDLDAMTYFLGSREFINNFSCPKVFKLHASCF